MDFHQLTSWTKRIAVATAALSLGACSLPNVSGRAPSNTLSPSARTKLAARVESRVVGHEGVSGFHMIPNGYDAFAARIALADIAEQSLDVQYFIWKNDLTGKILVERLLRAADRGARVRVLLDDLGSMPDDTTLLALDSHPNLEVRLFNPAAMRSPKLLGAALEIGRMNRRMHNKSFIVDGKLAIVGGRNVGDEYFNANKEMNFSDLDVAAIGPVVKEVSAAFDLYWNNRSALGISELVRWKPAPEKLAAIRTGLAAHNSLAKDSAYAKSLRKSTLVGLMNGRAVPYVWGNSKVVHDHPDKVVSPAKKTELHLAPQLRKLATAATREVYLVSPYFVPGRDGAKFLCNLRDRGVRVVVVTNSLASTDGLHVHGKYKNYRKRLLKCGVELYEIKPVAGTMRPNLRWTGLAPGTASLHTKSFSFDRRRIYVGSYNLDPRSRVLNTEMGIVMDSPGIAEPMARNLDLAVKGEAWRLELVRGRLEWVSTENGAEVRLRSEPASSIRRRLTATVMGWLPIEDLL